MIYAARYEAMNALVSYLTDHCSEGSPEKCAPRKTWRQKADAAC